jgi:hypothetical protein
MTTGGRATRQAGPAGGSERTADGGGEAAAREAERLAARDAAMCALSRDAALSALSAMQEMWGASGAVPSAAELLSEQSRIGALAAAAACRVECCELREEVRRLRAAEEATRAACTQQLGGLARACALLLKAGGGGDADAQLRREVLELCEQAKGAPRSK